MSMWWLQFLGTHLHTLEKCLVSRATPATLMLSLNSIISFITSVNDIFLFMLPLQLMILSFHVTMKLHKRSQMLKRP